MVSARGVKRRFDLPSGEPFWALKGIDLDAPEGKLTMLRGRSGSGKTTLLNILSALDSPTEGTVMLDGQDITNMGEGKRSRLRRKSVGFVFQSVALIPMMTAYENVEYALRLSRTKDHRDQRVQECLKMVGLGQRMQHMPLEMSGGEQQRVAIARAIAHRPRVLFADEPTAELDTTTGLQVIKIFQDLTRSEGITILMTTHDPGIMELGDHIYALEDGEIIDNG